MEQQTYRSDGWPLCPRCEEDELYAPGRPGGFSLEELPTAADLLRCYRCAWEGYVPPRGEVIGDEQDPEGQQKENPQGRQILTVEGLEPRPRIAIVGSGPRTVLGIDLAAGPDRTVKHYHAPLGPVVDRVTIRPTRPANKLPDVVEQDLDRQMKPGGRVIAEGDGRAYRMQAHVGTLRRETPKVKGKAARRSDKKRRRLERERQIKRINALLDEGES